MKDTSVGFVIKRILLVIHPLVSLLHWVDSVNLRLMSPALSWRNLKSTLVYSYFTARVGTTRTRKVNLTLSEW